MSSACEYQGYRRQNVFSNVEDESIAQTSNPVSTRTRVTGYPPPHAISITDVSTAREDTHRLIISTPTRDLSLATRGFIAFFS
ncbi:MAG: hypothetical protein ACE5EH_05730 [Gammaproteobacteria bacterium]